MLHQSVDNDHILNVKVQLILNYLLSTTVYLLCKSLVSFLCSCLRKKTKGKNLLKVVFYTFHDGT